MSTLSRRDQLQVDAAEGWLMLGNYREANEELERITSQRLHPSVLAMRWQVYTAAGWWESAWRVSKQLCEMFPDQPEAWLCHANTIRKYQGLQQAYELLKSVVERFPEDPVIPYNIACYVCQLGRIDECSQWLERCFVQKESLPLKLASVYDPDLKPLWETLPPIMQL